MFMFSPLCCIAMKEYTGPQPHYGQQGLWFALTKLNKVDIYFDEDYKET